MTPTSALFASACGIIGVLCVWHLIAERRAERRRKWQDRMTAAQHNAVPNEYADGN